MRRRLKLKAVSDEALCILFVIALRSYKALARSRLHAPADNAMVVIILNASQYALLPLPIRAMAHETDQAVSVSLVQSS